jgi:capsular polysaccharide biosynthesis protein
MTLSSTVRTLLRRWCITVPGLMLSLAIAGITFILIPPHYTSSGIAVLVQPNRPESLTTDNPLLAFDESVDTSALMLAESLNTPAVGYDLGLTPGRDTFTVKNVGSADTGGGIDQPFIYVTAQSSTPEKTAGIVADVMDLARQELADRQAALHVTQRNEISLENVVYPTTPKLAPDMSLAAAGAALTLGIIMTIIVAYVRDGALAGRRRRIDPFAALASEDIAPRAAAVNSSRQPVP